MATTPTTSARKRLFFPDGNHWHCHGADVHHRPDGNPSRAADSCIGVYSYFNKDRSHAPHVLLAAATPPADFLYQLSPPDARKFAADLIEAANTADEVRVALEAQQQRGR